MLSKRIGTVPLERALSKLGITSRTKARKLIEAGEVKINGNVITNPLAHFTPEKIKIEISGKNISRSKYRYFVLNKPKNLVTTSSDEKGRATVFSLFKEDINHLIAVGRLDMATTGLLIITNNTKLSNWLTDPINHIPRIYIVTVRGEFCESDLEKIESGIADNDEMLNADKVDIIKTSGKESILQIQLSEGKNREIRRIFLSLGHEVTKLKRISYGGLKLESINPGTVSYTHLWGMK